jgi:hypothetical protein
VHHPVDALTLYFAKFVNYFSPYNQPVTASEGSSGMRWIAIASWVGVVALVVLRLWWRKYLPLDRSERFFLGIFLANAFVMAAYFTRTRFRQPLDSILLVEAGIAIALGLGLWLASGKERTDVEAKGT